jgi:hypothetical protein
LVRWRLPLASEPEAAGANADCPIDTAVALLGLPPAEAAFPTRVLKAALQAVAADCIAVHQLQLPLPCVPGPRFHFPGDVFTK